jgi:putative flippase GtrA
VSQEKTNQTLWQAVKFTLFSISAGIIQAGSYVLLFELLLHSNQAYHWMAYLISLVLSVLWNFTLNRRYTFQSAANIPIAMLKVFGFYLVFTPVTLLLGQWVVNLGVNNYIVEGATMLSNLVLEYLFCKFVVYRGQENTRITKEN